jgi:hypothetical protein
MLSQSILVVDDERAQFIASRVRAKFTHFEVVECCTTSDAEQQMERLGKKIVAVVFDSAFGGDTLAGCKLFLKLVAGYPWLRQRSLFHTAFELEVYKELVAKSQLDRDNVIIKGTRSPRELITKLREIVEYRE